MVLQLIMEMFNRMFLLILISLLLITSGKLVRCCYHNEEDCNKDEEKSLNVRHLNDNKLLTSSNNNPNYYNNKNNNNNEYGVPYIKYSADNDYLTRAKRAPKNPDRSSIRKSKSTKQYKDGETSMTATDGEQQQEQQQQQQPTFQRNAVNGDGGRSNQPHYGGIRTEQTSTNNSDRMQERKAKTSGKEPSFVQFGTECNFDRECSWRWNTNEEFQVTSASEYDDEHKRIGPAADWQGNASGKFLLVKMTPNRRYLQVTSPLYNPSIKTCELEFWMYEEKMEDGFIKIALDNINHTQKDIAEIAVNDTKKWTKYKYGLGKAPSNFNVLIELTPPMTFVNDSLIAIDDIKLLNCFPDGEKNRSCKLLQFKCIQMNVCINNSQVCDITRDCSDDDDEKQNCDKIPYGARCNFEQDWCGWYNAHGKNLQWTRHNGTTSINNTVPSVDHTYRNRTGNYLHVLAEPSKPIAFASIATLRSVIFNPPPKVHGNVSSPYYNSCTIRFYLHQLGSHKSAFMLQVTELRPKENVSTDLIWSYSNFKHTWVRQEVYLPNITHRYYLHFEVRKGIRYINSIAIDDFSLSPECFGLNVPEEDLNGYDYWNSYINGLENENNSIPDFVNIKPYEITTCGATGRYGPTQENCTQYYNNTNVKVQVLNAPGMRGIQKWIVPSEGYYTLIVYGASGGKGSSGMGSSRGAIVRTVVELNKRQELYMLIGQEGTNACIRSLGHHNATSCRNKNDTDDNSIRALLNLDVTNGSGGGGGATYVFLRNRMKQSIPLAIAAGGGGLGLGRFVDTTLQHGQAINTSKPGVTGEMYGIRPGGAGGGWNRSPGNVLPKLNEQMGQSLLQGGIGGQACDGSIDRGDGGFGGGGGGCKVGGGGGGFAGGNSGSLKNPANGEGGYSFLDINRTVPILSEVLSGFHDGPGGVIILPAIQGCGCDYRCLALNARKSQVACICPKNWKLGSDGKSCILIDSGDTYPNWFVGVLIASFICLTAALSVICFILYNRYQQRAEQILRRKMLSGTDLQLNRLRGVASDSMMTEYNPNYEFGGVVYTLKDLKDIPRDQLRLVKALGQGAFGEVYQGFYRQRSGDTVEMPVAVKTLPEMSTNEAEIDFLMEALIMSKFNHPNIVHFIGVCFDKHPRFIVLELLVGGDLKNFLRESRPKPERGSPLTMKDLVLIAIDVAKGCKYLEENRFIHRDIAARNCLLTTKGPGRVVKIADFGMSRDIYRSEYYRKGGKAMLPIKWMPPEAFLDGIFTSKTDVWSFGVLLWEIMSMGYMPYTGCANRDVMQLVTSGGRLEPPANCPGPIYGIMTQCWHPTPEERPTFALIRERLGYCSQDPQVMNAPLPVFNRPPSHEKDATVMRPQSNDNNCLQVPQTTDYLIPNHTVPIQNVIGSTSSVDKLLPENSDSWETSFAMPHSKSTQPLLQENEPPTETNCIANEKLLDIDKSNVNTTNKLSPLPNNVHNHNNNAKSELNNLKSGVSLDAGALAKQTVVAQKYANITPGSGDSINKTGNGIVQNGPYINNTNFLNNANKKKNNET